MPEQEQDNNSFKELDLAKIIINTWNIKWYIISIAAISIILAAIYSHTKKPNDFLAKLEMKIISDFEYEQYKELSLTLKEQKGRFFSVHNLPNFNFTFQVSQIELFHLFMDDLLSRNSLIQSIKEHQILQREDFVGEEEFEKAVLIFSYKYQIDRENKQENKKSTYSGSISFNTDDKQLDESILKNALIKTNNNVQELLLGRYNRIIERYKVRKKYLIEDLDILINNSFQDYERKKNKELLHLSEQAEMARAYGIKNFVDVFEMNNTQIKSDWDSGELTFLHGYEMLEKRKEIINSRSNKENFIKGLPELMEKKRAINQELFLERMTSAFEKSPLNTQDFKAAIYDLNLISYEQKIVNFLFYRTAVILFLFGSLALFIHKVISQSKRNL